MGSEGTGAFLGNKLGDNIDKLKIILGSSPDIVIREFYIGYNHDLKAAILLIEGLANTELVNTNILKPLMFNFPWKAGKASIEKIEDIGSHCIPFCKVTKITALADITDKITSGDTILIVDGFTEAIDIGTKKWEKRAIEEPMTESVIRGPREGFTETISVNISMLRRRIKNTNLQFEQLKIGKQTQTDVLIVFVEGIANPTVIDEVRKRLASINIDSVLDSGYIEAFIQDSPYSVFRTVGNSERPDVVASRLLEGRVAVLVDGSPFALTVPMLFIEDFQSPEDYYLKFYYSSILRIIRYVSFFIATMTPAIYVALTTFHQELIPSTLLYTMVAGHEAIPLPAILEAFIMLLFFDIMFEAGLRLPKIVGSAVSIVGALVIGQSAVTAGLVSPFMIIVVALTAISSFVVSPQNYSPLVLRYFFTLIGGVFGGYGITMGLMVVLFHMFSLKSFGAPYLSPIYPLNGNDLKDSFIVAPIWKMNFRPKAFSSPNRKRR